MEKKRKKRKKHHEKKRLGTLEKSEETDAGLQEDSLHLEIRESLQKNPIRNPLDGGVDFRRDPRSV